MLKLKKGFTLIELLVVIAVMAVIASAVIVLINPLDKIKAANDSKVQSDIGQIATALTAYATANNGVYPTTAQGLSVLAPAELSAIPKPPTATGYGSAYGYVGTATTAQVTGTLQSSKYTTPLTPVWMWCNVSTQAGAVAATNSSCPNQ